jgi:cell division protease FtsH
MVCIFGMSESIGLVRCVQRQNGAYLMGADGAFQRDCSERTAQEIDDEVKAILDQAYEQAKTILTDHREQLEAVTQKLLENETLDAKAFSHLIGLPLQKEPERNRAGFEGAPPDVGNGQHTEVE